MLPVSDFKSNRKKTSFSLPGKVKVRILVFFGLLACGLLFAQLVFANNLSTDGEKLSQIQEEIQKLQDENTTLKVEISKESSLSTLSREAKDMGFTQPGQTITLKSSF